MTTAPIILEERPRSPVEYSADGVIAPRSWTVIAASIDAAKLLLLTTLGVDYGSVYETPQGERPDERSVLQRFSVDPLVPAPLGGTGLYRVSASYSPISDSGEPGAPSLPGGPPIYRLERTLVNSPIDHDKDGNPLMNTVDEPIVDRTKLETIKVLVIEWWIEATDILALDLQLAAYEGKVNGAVWHGAPVGCLFCRELKAEGQRPTGGKFRVIGKWEFKPQKTLFDQTYEGWEETILNFGTRTRSSVLADVDYLQVTDANGVPLTSPVPLSAGGMRLAEDEDPHVLSFKLYGYADFSALGV